MNLRHRTQIRKALALSACVLMFVLVGIGLAGAQVDYTKGIDFSQNLGAQVPLATAFRDESGKTVHLGEFFQGRPVILVPIAFRCQTACAMVTDSLLKTLTTMTKIPRARLSESHNALVGRDLDVVFVSIDPTEDDPESVRHPLPARDPAEGPIPLPNDGHVAQTKKDLILNSYEQPGSEHGWHFLTGSLDNVHKVTDAIGLHYYFDPKTDVLRNPTGIVFLTPSGKISSYILGSDFATVDLDADFKLAAQEKIGRKSDRIMFVCFTPDANVGRNRVLIESVVRWACFATLAALIASIVKLSLPDWRKPFGGGRTHSST